MCVCVGGGGGQIIEALEGLLWIWDTFVKIQRTFRVMVIQSFLKGGEFWGICPLLFRDMGYLGPFGAS